MWLIGWYPDKSERTSLIVVNEIQRAIEAVESEQWEGVDPDQISDYISSLVYSEIDFTVQDTFGAIDEDAMSRGKKLQSETANGSVATLGPLALSALASANFALFGDDVFDLAVAIVTIPSFLVLVWRNLRLQTHLYYRAIRISDCVRNLDPTQFRAT